MRSVWIVCALVGIFVIVDLNVNDALIFRFTNFVCKNNNQSWVGSDNCRLKAISRSKVILNFNATLLHPVNNVRLHLKLFKKANGYKPWLFDRSIDFCRFQRTRYDPFAKIVYGLFKNFTNLNNTCPFTGTLVVEGFYLRPELLRLPLPTGDYMLCMRYYFGMSMSPTMVANVSVSFVEDLLKSN